MCVESFECDLETKQIESCVFFSPCDVLERTEIEGKKLSVIGHLKKF